jgi:CRP-like cAMP-binding protein
VTEKDDVVNVLRTSGTFRDLPDDALRAIAYAARRLTLEDEEVLFREGDAGEAAYVVIRGAVEIVHRPPGEPDRGEVRAVAESGELFGELALFGGGHRHADARARGRMVVAELSYEPFVEIIRAWPDTAMALLRLQTERFVRLEHAYRAAREKR